MLLALVSYIMPNTRMAEFALKIGTIFTLLLQLQQKCFLIKCILKLYIFLHDIDFIIIYRRFKRFWPWQVKYIMCKRLRSFFPAIWHTPVNYILC